MINLAILDSDDRHLLACSPFASCKPQNIPHNWRDLLIHAFRECWICGGTTWCRHREPELVRYEIEQRERLREITA